MSLEIGEAFQEGYERTVALPGLMAAGLLFVLMLVNAAVTQSLTVRVVEEMRSRMVGRGPPEMQRRAEEAIASIQRETPLAMDLALEEAVLAVVAVAILAETVYIVAVRLFAGDDPDGLPDRTTRRLGRATLHGVVAGLLTWLLVIVGLVFLIVPGIFVGVSLFFVRQEVAIDDRGFVGALSASWTRTEGNRVEVLGLGLVLFVLVYLASFVGGLFSFVSPLAGVLVRVALQAVVGAFSVAVVTRAYEQLRTGRGAGPGAPGTPSTPGAPEDVTTTGATDADDPAARHRGRLVRPPT